MRQPESVVATASAIADGVSFLRHCQSPDAKIANTEYMFPYVTVVQCPQEQMIQKIRPTLVATAITKDKKWERQLTDATNIDRLNIGPIPATKLDFSRTRGTS